MHPNRSYNPVLLALLWALIHLLSIELKISKVQLLKCYKYLLFNWHSPSISALSGANSGICVSSNSGRPVNLRMPGSKSCGLKGSQPTGGTVGVPGCDVERIAATSAFCCSMLCLGLAFTANGLSCKSSNERDQH